jgi:hypothetical protein
VQAVARVRIENSAFIHYALYMRAYRACIRISSPATSTLEKEQNGASYSAEEAATGAGAGVAAGPLGGRGVEEVLAQGPRGDGGERVERTSVGAVFRVRAPCSLLRFDRPPVFYAPTTHRIHLSSPLSHPTPTPHVASLHLSRARRLLVRHVRVTFYTAHSLALLDSFFLIHNKRIICSFSRPFFARLCKVLFATAVLSCIFKIKALNPILNFTAPDSSFFQTLNKRKKKQKKNNKKNTKLRHNLIDTNDLQYFFIFIKFLTK